MGIERGGELRTEVAKEGKGGKNRNTGRGQRERGEGDQNGSGEGEERETRKRSEIGLDESLMARFLSQGKQ